MRTGKLIDQIKTVFGATARPITNRGSGRPASPCSLPEPFTCDVCGEERRGNDTSLKSNGQLVICIHCALGDEEDPPVTATTTTPGNTASNEVGDQRFALHLHKGQKVAECPHCKGLLSKETPILAGDENEPMMMNRQIVGIRLAPDPRPKCPHCYGRFELTISLRSAKDVECAHDWKNPSPFLAECAKCGVIDYTGK